MFQTKIVGERPRARGRLFFSFLATPILKILIKQVGSPLALRADGMWTALAALGAAGAAAAAGALVERFDIEPFPDFSAK